MNRMDKVNQLFKREISNMILLGEVSDPRLRFMSITFVDISKDLSVAHVGFSVLDDSPQGIQSAQAGLNSASGRIRHLIAERVEIRHIPEIRFVYDNSIAYGMKMDRQLDEIRRAREGAGMDDGLKPDKA
jgi:ribosome-binding factor A